MTTTTKRSTAAQVAGSLATLRLAVPLAIVALCALPARASVLGHWKLDGTGTSTSAPNTAPTPPAGSDGTLTNFEFDAADGWRTGQVDSAVLFDAVDEFIDTGNDIFDSHDVGTITAWINVDSFTTSAFGGAIFTSASDTNSNNFLRFSVDQVSGNNSLKIGGQFGGTSREVASSTTDLPTATWLHVAAQSDGTNWHLFVNGVEEATTLIIGSDDGSWFNYNNTGTETNSYAIGQLSRSTGPVNRFDGTIDEVGFFSDVLAEAQIRAMYTLGLTAGQDGSLFDFNYDLGEVQEIFTAFAAQDGVAVQDDAWVYATGLNAIKGSAIDGDLFSVGQNVYLMIDSTGIGFGMAIITVPEPTTFGLLRLTLAAACATTRRRRAACRTT